MIKILHIVSKKRKVIKEGVVASFYCELELFWVEQLALRRMRYEAKPRRFQPGERIDK